MARLKPVITAAINRQIRRGDDFDRWSKKKYGIPGRWLAAKLVSGENPGGVAVSSAGARGFTQFIPGTRSDFIRRYGIDPWRSPDDNVKAMKIHLMGRGGAYGGGLAGYNPGMPSYPGYILKQPIDPKQFRGKGGGAGGGAGGRTGDRTLQGNKGRWGFGDEKQSYKVVTSARAPQLIPSKLEFAETDFLLDWLQNPKRGSLAKSYLFASEKGSPYTQETPERVDEGEVKYRTDKLPELKSKYKAGSPDLIIPGERYGGVGRKLSPGGGWGGSRNIARGLAALGFGAGLKNVSEKRGTRNTSSGNMSDHYSGNRIAYAFDLSNGSAPTPQMDRAAARIAQAVGALRQWRAQGSKGILNVTRGNYRIQMLYRTDKGGNHWNHVHVGVKRIR